MTKTYMCLIFPASKGNERNHDSQIRNQRRLVIIEEDEIGFYRFGIEYENFHAGDVLKHPVDVITHRCNQHHRFPIRLPRSIRSFGD